MFRNALWASWVTCICLMASPNSAAAADNIVLYASDATTLTGNWARTAAASAAGGQMLSSADRGWSATNKALTNPAHYVEFSFTAPAGVSYGVWLRLRAGADSKYNDSVYAQFSDAVTASGSAMYRIGSTNALTVNLQSCDGCLLAGWGWINSSYWLSQNTTVRFAAGGTHVIRIQTREDGVSLDQVVLSPSTYVTASPGQVMNDSTIVSKESTTGTVSTASAPTTASVAATPFSGTAVPLPGTVEAEAFDNGGEGVAYHDTTTANSGGAYRKTGVDLEAASQGGYDVGWIATGEWLSYSVNVATAGTYLLEARVAAAGQGGTFHVDFNGTNATGAMAIPDTGGWQSWTTVSRMVTLAAGTQAMRVTFDTAGAVVGNLNWLRVSAAATAPLAAPAAAIPGVIQPETFDDGGEGIAYHDTTAGNSGGAVRDTGVDIEARAGGGYDIGWTADGEWLRYAVNVAAAGDYIAQFSVASPYSSGRVSASIGASTTTVLSVPNTGGWQSWTTITAPMTLAAGAQSLKIFIATGGFNLGSMTLTAVVPAPAPAPAPEPTPAPAPAPAPEPAPAPTGRTLTVNAGDNLQAALDAALPGDTLLLQAGATFTGNFILPVKSGTDFITIRSAAPDSALPPANVRITPAYAAQLPKIRSSNTFTAMATAPGAHHYRIMLVEFIANVQGYGDILTLGDGDSQVQTTIASVPHDLIVDRVYMHGDPTYGQKRAIGLNSASTTIVNSYIADIKASGQDSQAIAGWNGPGPFTITNNYLEAAGENILIGGSDPGIPNLVPSDITISRNYLTKQLAWRTQSQWNVKNLLELKNAQRVTIDGNVMEYSWEAAQSGYAVVFTPRNQGGTAPWSIVQEVQFTNNIVRHVGSGINILGRDDEQTSQLTNHIVIRNNLFDDVSGKAWGGAGRMALIGGGADITIDHNTVIQDGWTVLYAYGPAATGFTFTNNIVPDYSWAIMGADTAPGNGTIATYFPAGRFTNGIFAGGPSWSYPAGNYFPASMADVGFIDLAGRNYRLGAASPYRGAASDRTDIGCNIDALNAAAGTSY